MEGTALENFALVMAQESTSYAEAMDTNKKAHFFQSHGLKCKARYSASTAAVGNYAKPSRSTRKTSEIC